jgi:hypothetical protein
MSSGRGWIRWVLGCLALACGDEPAREQPLFPADYASSYVEVRNCRASTDHDLTRVRVLAAPDTAAAYMGRDEPFDPGALVLKAEYDYADTSCEGEIASWTLMRRLVEGSSPQTLDWEWQDVDADRRVVSTNDSRCVGCHTACGMPPGGYQGTCTEE